MVVVELDSEVCEIIHKLPGITFGQFFRCDTEFPGFEHDRRTVRIGRTDVDAVVTAQFLESDPDIGLDVLDKMPHVRRAVGIGQSAGNENFARRLGSHQYRSDHGKKGRLL